MRIDYGAAAPVALLLAALLLVSALVRRIPIVGGLVSLALWGGLLFAAVTLVRERGRFDPLLGRAAGLLGIEEQRVTGGETRIAMSADGHFWARATIDGVPRRMLIDSGATLTALDQDTARAAGLAVTRPAFPMVLRTANGAVEADTATIGELRLGSIVARDLPAVVSPAFGDTAVIGMNLLWKLASWRVEGRTLILVPHHPQKVAERD